MNDPRPGETSAKVFVAGTMDTKRDELLFVVDCLRALNVDVCVVDLSAGGGSTAEADVHPQQISGEINESKDSLAALDRGAAVIRMTEAFAAFMVRQQAAGHVSGILGIGGSGGTAIVTAAMRRMPVGMPKLMVSTVASGNTAPYVDCNDICMMYSVVDVAGLNVVSRRILSNAAHAMAGMVRHALPSKADKPTIGMTMFGVTTACVTRVRELLEAKGFDCLVFHATGAGGRAMEKLVSSGLIRGVLDITTTEVADEVVGGVFPAGPHRFEAILQQQIPLVMSLGAMDMVNFGARETVPEQFSDRNLYVHNSQVTLMRTNLQENVAAADWIAAKLNKATSPFAMLMPEAGVSALDSEGKPFFDPQADNALMDTLERDLQGNPHADLRRLPLHINDAAFADALVETFLHLHNAWIAAQ